MRITIFGAAGNVGSRAVTEALSRGHEVTAVIRNPARLYDFGTTVKVCVGDAENSEDIAKLSAGQDLVITATRPQVGHERELVTITRALFAGLGKTGMNSWLMLRANQPYQWRTLP